MADFEIRIAERAFNNLGVYVLFDESLYGELLDELVEPTSTQQAPLVRLEPAPIWGASKVREFISMMAGRDQEWPGGNYARGTTEISVRASAKVAETNDTLLYNTRRWSADVTGEMRQAFAIQRDHRYLRRAEFISGLGVGALAGLEIAGQGGAIIGGLFGATAGLAGNVVDTRRNPYFKAWSEFPSDPDVAAKFGQIVRYETA